MWSSESFGLGALAVYQPPPPAVTAGVLVAAVIASAMGEQQQARAEAVAAAQSIEMTLALKNIPLGWNMDRSREEVRCVGLVEGRDVDHPKVN